MSTPVGDSWSLPALEHSSTLEQTHRVLRDAIVDGAISQGAHLREIHLAQSLGTSRGTVREAIRQLVRKASPSTSCTAGRSCWRSPRATASTSTSHAR